MDFQKYSSVPWSTVLKNVICNYTGLVVAAELITGTTPDLQSGRYNLGCIINNIVTMVSYQNFGSVAVPVWVIVAQGGGSGGVISFNTRTGAVTLTASDVDTALGYTPFNFSNFTAGSILFISSGSPSQDNNNFYIQDSPTTPQQLGSNTNVAISVNTNSDFTGTNAINIYSQYDAYLPNSLFGVLTTDGATPGYTVSTSRGTGPVPIQSQSGDFVGHFTGWTAQGVSPAYTPVAGALIYTSGSSTNNLGGEYQIWTKGDGGILTKWFTILNTGVANALGGIVVTGNTTTNNVILPNNAITAVGNTATVPITSKFNTVTNNSATALTITFTTAGAVDGQIIILDILDFSAVAQTLNLVNTENSGVSVPTATNGSTTLPLTIGLKFNGLTSKWRIQAFA